MSCQSLYKPSKQMAKAIRLGFKCETPRIVKIHTCGVCGKEFTWDKNSRLFSSIFDEENGYILVTCGKKCQETLDKAIGD